MKLTEAGNCADITGPRAAREPEDRTMEGGVASYAVRDSPESRARTVAAWISRRHLQASSPGGEVVTHGRYVMAGQLISGDASSRALGNDTAPEHREKQDVGCECS
jgi:hypothetical protein